MVARKLWREQRKGIGHGDGSQGGAVEGIGAGGADQPKSSDLAVLQDLETEGHSTLLAQPRGLRDDRVPMLPHHVNHARQVGAEIHPFRIRKDNGAFYVEIRIEIVELGKRVSRSRDPARRAAARRRVERLLDGIAGRPCGEIRAPALAFLCSRGNVLEMKLSYFGLGLLLRRGASPWLW